VPAGARGDPDQKSGLDVEEGQVSRMRSPNILALVLFAISLTAAEEAETGGPMGRQLVFVSGNGPTVSCFALDATSGSLTQLS